MFQFHGSITLQIPIHGMPSSFGTVVLLLLPWFFFFLFLCCVRIYSSISILYMHTIYLINCCCGLLAMVQKGIPEFILVLPNIEVRAFIMLET
jgi:hypothetical protein